MQEECLKERNDLSQMECLYETYYVRLHRYAQTFLGDEDEATDVVGEIFLHLWEKMAGW